jgi:hypothetical protein
METLGRSLSCDRQAQEGQISFRCSIIIRSGESVDIDYRLTCRAGTICLDFAYPVIVRGDDISNVRVGIVDQTGLTQDSKKRRPAFARLRYKRLVVGGSISIECLMITIFIVAGRERPVNIPTLLPAVYASPVHEARPNPSQS